MFAIIGILVVLGAVIGGFLMEHGPIRVLIQPSEAIIICGAALGTLLVANPLHTLKEVMNGILQVLKGSKFSKKRYLDSLKMMYDMFNKIRRDGPNSVENDIEEPGKSKFFAAFPDFVKDHHARDFVCDTMRMVLMGGRRALRRRSDDRGRHGRPLP
jgi:chemotaxis protein MotA